MAIPLDCGKCGDPLGCESDIASLGRMSTMNFDSLLNNIYCPGKGKHEVQTKSSTISWDGLVEKNEYYYPDSGGTNSSIRYTGPNSEQYLRKALKRHVFTFADGSTQSIRVLFKHVRIDSQGKFEGEGLDELIHMLHEDPTFFQKMTYLF